MSYPSGWDLVNVTGTYIGKNGVPCVGSVTFSSPQLVLRSGTIVPAADIVFNLVNGAFSGQIPATDDPNANPVGWVYTVTENVPGGRQGYQIVAPHASSGIDLSTVVPVTMPMPPTFGFPYVTLAQLAGTVVGDGAYLIGYQINATGSVAETVQSKLNLLAINVEDFGAVGDGVTNDYAAIMAAIAFVGSNNGGQVIFQAKTYLCGSPIVVDLSNVVLIGQGGNTGHDGGTGSNNGTTLSFPATGTGIAFRTTNVTTQSMRTGGGMQGICIQCNGTTNQGLTVTSWRNGYFRDIFISEAVTNSVLISASLHTGAVEATDTQGCIFENVVWRSLSAAAQNSVGLTCTSANPGTNGGNTSFNTFMYCYGQVDNGDCWQIIDGDNNSFFGCRSYVIGTGNGLSIKGGDTNYFWDFSTAGAPIHIYGTASGAFANPQYNCFWNSDEGNGTPYPTLDTGCAVQWHGCNYGFQKMRCVGATFTDSASVMDAQRALLGSDTIRIFNSSGNGVTLTDGTHSFVFSIAGGGGLRITSGLPGATFDLTQSNPMALKVQGFGAFASGPITTQPTAGGTTAGFTANTGTAMNAASTSTGGIGSQAYTFGDLVHSLKNYGLLAS